MIQSFYDSVLEQIDDTAEKISLDPGIHKMIKKPAITLSKFIFITPIHI